MDTGPSSVAYYGFAVSQPEAPVLSNKLGNTVLDFRLPSSNACNFTRNGEDRIKGCRKVDLGGGYRLGTLKQGKDLYLLFVGTHDECGRWVENNRLHLPLIDR